MPRNYRCSAYVTVLESAWDEQAEVDERETWLREKLSNADRDDFSPRYATELCSW